MSFLQTKPSLSRSPQFLGLKSTPNLFSPSLFSRKGNEAPLWELSVINAHRANDFRKVAGRVINPNTVTVTKPKPGLRFASYSPSLQRSSVAIANLKPPAIRVSVTPEHYSKSIPNTIRGQPRPKKDAVMQLDLADSDVHIYGVCDGHGTIGGEMAHFVATKLPSLVHSRLSQSQVPIEKAIRQAFSDMQYAIAGEYGTSAETSGCTCICVVLIGATIYCANLGDSRAMLARKYESAWIGIPLSEDHKPTRLLEVERIVKAGGKVEPLKDAKNEPYGPPLVWIEGKDAPALTVTRSFGDVFAHEVGVSKDPEVLSFQIVVEDRIMIIASDGVWAVMNIQEVAELASHFSHLGVAQDFCTQLVDTALHRWSGRGDYIDDISVIVVFLR